MQRRTVAKWGLATALLSASAVGWSENPNVLPLGEREAWTANAGVAGSGSAGATFYNPAALTTIADSSLSVSGSTYFAHTIEAKPLVRLDGTPLDYRAASFQTIPASVASVIRWGPWALGVSLLVPEALNIENRLTLVTPNTSSTLVQVTSSEELWIGFSAARPLTDRLSLGGTVFLMQRTSSTAVGIFSRFPAVPTVAGISQEHIRTRVYQLALALGAHWRAARFLDLGVRVRLPGVHLAGSGDGYRFEQNFDNLGVLQIREVSQDDIQARAPAPLDAAVGASWNLGADVHLLTDASVQFAADVDHLPNSFFSRPRRLNTKLRFNLGVVAPLADDWELGAGVLLCPTTAAPSTAATGDFRHNAYGATAGVSYRSDRVRTGVGLFYLGARGNLIPGGEIGPLGTATQRLYGATLLFRYSLGSDRTSTTTPAPAPASSEEVPEV